MITPKQKRIIEAAARKYGIDPAVEYGVWGTETEFSTDPNIGSPAGAVGPTQFLPSTAQGLGINPHKVRGALFGTAKYLSRYKDRGVKGMLAAYNAGPAGSATNPETAAYIPKVLRYAEEYKKTGLGGNPGASSQEEKLVAAASRLPTTRTESTPLSETFNTLASLESAPGSNPYAPQGQDNYKYFENLARRQEGQEETTSQLIRAARRSMVSEPEVSGSSQISPKGGVGKVIFASEADRNGASTQPVVKQFLSQVAGSIGKPITVGTGTNHSQYTVDGNVSDHWTGHASDIPVPVDSRQGDLIAGRALMVAGIPERQARSMAQKGGLYTITPTTGPFKGRRVQIIWKTEEGGNHHNHVHTGIE